MLFLHATSELGREVLWITGTVVLANITGSITMSSGNFAIRIPRVTAQSSLERLMLKVQFDQLLSSFSF